MTVVPGYPGSEKDVRRIKRLKPVRVTMLVGENDGRWVTAAESTQQLLRRGK